MIKTFWFSILLIIPIFGFGQAWTKNKGEQYYQIGYTHLKGKGLYLPNGNTSFLSRSVTDQTIQVYGEYGISDKITVSSSIPIKMVRTGELQNIVSIGSPEPATSLTSFGNIELSAYYGIRQNQSLVLSAGLKTSLPTANQHLSSGLKTGYGCFGIGPTFNIGYGATNYFTQHSSTFNYRTNDYSHQYQSSTSLGMLIEEKLYLILSIDMLISMYNGKIDKEEPFLTGLYVNNLEYITQSLKVGYCFKNNIKLWGSIGGGIWGSYVLKAPAITTSISYDF